MKKIKKLLGTIFLAFVFLGTGIAGVLFANNNNSNFTNAEFSNYDSISNDLPDYFKIEKPNSASESVGYVGDTIYLFQTNSYKSVKIATDTVTRTVDNEEKENWAYYPNKTENPNEYYYFDFQNSLSLYYNLTNEQIKGGATGVNLLQGKSISDYTKPNEKAFTPTNYNFTPRQLNIKFTLSNSFDYTDNTVQLGAEGCYTLVVPLVSYYTDNGGATFTSSEQLVYYTFMVFKSSTYFNAANGYQNLTPSENLQISSTTSTTFSRYYFYNYSYALNENLLLPSITYNPNVYEIRVDFTNVDDTSSTRVLEYSSIASEVTQKDENGNIVEDSFVYAAVKDGNVTLYFRDIGTYDLSFKYLYKSVEGDEETTYALPLEQLVSSSSTPSIFKNKNQRLFVYGYQAKFSDYSNVDELTNQPVAKELKSFDYENGIYTLSADITSGLNNFITTQYPDIDVSAVNPSSSAGYASNDLKTAAEAYINQKDDDKFVVNPVSTNQTPVKFLNNVNLLTSNSYIYKVNDVNDNRELDEGVTFEGFNQNEAGTYLYIIEYTYDSFLSTNGTLQASYVHYQVFYFTVTSSIPKVTILDEDFNEVYTSSYTNKSVYILNDAENNVYDAKVTILLSAKNYNTGNYYFQDMDITRLSSFSINYTTFDSPEIAGKQGVFIDTGNIYANANYTVKIYSTNTVKPSVKTFTIDTNEITGIKARNVSLSSSNLYRIDEDLESYNTNCSVVFSWTPKPSGASTSAFIKYVPFDQISYYATNDLSELLYYLVNTNKTLPVSYKLNLNNSSDWTEYKNSVDSTTVVNASFVKSEQGLYILEVFDQAGNTSFEIFMIDKTQPVFVLNIASLYDDYRRLMASSEVLSVPEAGTEVNVEWAENKAFYVDNIDKIDDYKAYQYTIDPTGATEKLINILKYFFDPTKNESLKVFNNIGGYNTQGTGIGNYNGTYLTIALETSAYVKSANPNESALYNGGFINASSYQVKFLDENMAIEGTYDIFVRDASNNKLSGLSPEKADLKFKNASSSYVSFNVTSDATKMGVKFVDEEKLLRWADFSLPGTLYQDNEHVYYYEQDEENTLTHDGPSYKFAYYTPIDTSQKIALSFIPLPENGAELDFVEMKYYPFKKSSNGLYYTIDSTPEKIIRIYTYGTEPVEMNEEKIFEINFGGSLYPKAGRYVIERNYRSTENIDQYDYYRRIVTFTVDEFGLITPLENVSQGDDVSLQSLVGRDIYLSMYSDPASTNIEISFPKIENGLAHGSFFTKESFGLNEDDDRTDDSVLMSVEGNKLPMKLYIPQYKYTIGPGKGVSDYSVKPENSLSYYGNGYISPVYREGETQPSSYDVIIEGIKVENFTQKDRATEYLQKASTKQYEIYVKVSAKIKDARGNINTYHYASNKVTSNGYLTLFEANKDYYVAQNANIVDYFSQPGKYYVTIYQAYNDGNTNSFYKLYKFGFEILSSEPDFDILNKDGYTLTATNQANVYYTNSETLTVEWEVPQSDYMAKIDESNIYIRGSIYKQISQSDIKTSNNIRYFELDCRSIIESPNSSITISMQYEGSQTYYNVISKTVYFDISAPIENLKGLMTKTSDALNNTLSVEYQQIYMRTYRNYKNETVEVNGRTDFNNLTLSYSYSTPNQPFKYYCYNVTPAFFNETLYNTIASAAQKPKGTQFIYFKDIGDNILSYQQTDKDSFSPSNNYTFVEETNDVRSGHYYEIVEYDYAKNMVVYYVYVIEDINTNVAVSYTNTNIAEAVAVKDSQITNGFNLYSTSGFTLESYNYMSDPWGIFTVQKAGERSTKLYMRSPNLQANNAIYQITQTTSGIELTQTSLSEIFAGVLSSDNKHKLVFTDRTTGTNKLVYLSIMDAIINPIKVKDPYNAILKINTPTEEQQASTTKAYVYPVNVKIFKFNNNTWEQIMEANQLTYGIWTPTSQYEADFGGNIKFDKISSAVENALQISISVGKDSTAKFKYEIKDNFGKVTPVIQLANEEEIDKETKGESTVYTIIESTGEVTYVSDQTLTYTYNTLLHKVNVYTFENGSAVLVALIDGVNTIDDYGATAEVINYTSKGLKSIKFYTPTATKQWNMIYKIEVLDVGNDDLIKTIYLRLYYQLPYTADDRNKASEGGIVFNDKNQQNLPPSNYETVLNKTITFNGEQYTSFMTKVSTYSQNVTVFYPRETVDRTGRQHYLDEYGYTVYLSRDNGQTWENINSETSNGSGYTISGVGEYLIFIRYNSDEIFKNVFLIYGVNILDSSASYYYITVDGVKVNKSDMKYTDQNGIEYQTNYIVGIDIDDKARLVVVPNEELNVIYRLERTEITGTNVYVEIYTYSCPESRGAFTIIYIHVTPSDSIVSLFTYETSSGSTTSLKSVTSEFVAANKETEGNFTRLKLNFSSYYGIEQNKIKIDVQKLFNGTYVDIYPTVYENGNNSYIYLNRAGSYRLRLSDSCTPSHSQYFKTSDHVDLIFLNSTPITVTYTDVDGEEVTAEFVQKAVYNSSVKISLNNLTTYYQPSGYPVVKVKRNGADYSRATSSSTHGYIENNNQYTFNEPGYYSVIFSATSTTGVQLREEEFNFTIINKNESRYAYEFANYNKYYIVKVVKDDIDITEDLKEISNFDQITINNKTYMTNLLINFLDEKTGGGKYRITISPNDEAYINTIGNEFTFDFWINMANPPINVSLAEGQSTTKNIVITFNTRNLYNAVGDCYLVVGGTTRHYTSENIETYSEIQTITLTGNETYFIQLYTAGGQLLYSYKVTKNEPLNAFAIIAIVIAVAVAVAVVVITIRLRKRQKTK